MGDRDRAAADPAVGERTPRIPDVPRPESGDRELGREPGERVKNLPQVESFPKISEAVATAVSAALLGKMTPQEALDSAAQQVDTELAGGERRVLAAVSPRKETGEGEARVDSDQGRSWGTRSCGSGIPRSSRAPRVSWTTSPPKEGSTPSSSNRSSRTPVLSIATDEARGMPGVVCVLTGAELGLPPMHEVEDVPETFARPVLCDGIMRFVGEPVAVVVAESRRMPWTRPSRSSSSTTHSLRPSTPSARSSRTLPCCSPSMGATRQSSTRCPRTPACWTTRRSLSGRGSSTSGWRRPPWRRTARSPSPTGHRRAHGVVAGAVALRLAEDGRADPRHGGVEGSRHRSEGRRRVRREDPDLRGAGGGLWGSRSGSGDRSGTWRPGRRAVRHDAREEPRCRTWSSAHAATGTITGLRVRIAADAGAYPDEGATLPPLTGLMASGRYTIPRIHSPPSRSRPTPRRSGPTGAQADRRRRRSSSA